MAYTTGNRETRRESLRKSQAIEISAFSHYASQGYRILMPLVDGEGYDFVAEKHGIYVRVNVKLATQATPNSWRFNTCAGGNRRKEQPDNVDIYLVWLPGRDEFYEATAGSVAGIRCPYITQSNQRTFMERRNPKPSETSPEQTGHIG